MNKNKESNVIRIKVNGGSDDSRLLRAVGAVLLFTVCAMPLFLLVFSIGFGVK